MIPQLIGTRISEAVAIFIIIAFGDSVACMHVLSDPSLYVSAYWGVCLSWGLAITFAIYVSQWRGTSGGATTRLRQGGPARKRAMLFDGPIA